MYLGDAPKDDAPKDETEAASEEKVADAEATDAEAKESIPPSPEDESEDETEDNPLLAESATAKNPETPYLGASVREQSGKLVVSRIVRGSPADLAGWNVDDELLAVGDFRATESLMGSYLHQFPIGKPIETLLSRRGQLIHRNLVLAPHRSDDWKLKSIKKLSDDLKARRKQWLEE
jgi:predicted metalloprotease with PDZ domain